MRYDDGFLNKNLDEIMTYKVAQSWSRLRPNCQILSKKEFLGTFKCRTYVPIVPHYATYNFTNILRVGHNI